MSKKDDFVLSAPTKHEIKAFEPKVPGTPPIVPPTVASSDKEHLRQIVICEIINTERDYVRDLKLIQVYFETPMTVELRASIGLSDAELSQIFSNLDAICSVNQKFLSSLEQVHKKANGGLVVDISKPFLDHVNTFAIYGEYLCNQPEQMKTINRLKKDNAEFESFLAEKMLEPELKGLCLFSYLVKPVQRICKYPLLLRELNKNTEPSNRDLATLQEAIRVIEQAVTSINEKKRVTDEMSRIMELTQVIEGFDKLGIDEVKDRRLMKEHACSVVTESGNEEGNMYLFNDLLVTALKLKKKRKGFNGFVHAVVTLTRAYYKDMRVQQDENKQIKIEDPMTNSAVVLEVVTNDDEELVRTIKSIVDETKATRQRMSMSDYGSQRQSIMLGLTDEQRAALKTMGPSPTSSLGSNTPHRRPPPPPPKEHSSAPPTPTARPPANAKTPTATPTAAPLSVPAPSRPQRKTSDADKEEKRISVVPLAQPATPTAAARRPPPTVPAATSGVVVASAKGVQRVSVKDAKPVRI